MGKGLTGVKNIHLVGIGGVGMSGLAFLLKDKGYNIKGSDITPGAYTEMLEREGIAVTIGHSPQNITADIDLVGFSSAVDENNPELAAARKKGLTVLKRGELLGLISWDKNIIAVSGSHGKTTTTSLLGYLLTSLGYQPAVFIGGCPLNYSRTAWWGQDYFVIETDESDGSFLFYNPWVSVITNIDYEHLDYHKTFDNLHRSFAKFAYQTRDKVIGCGDDPRVRNILTEVDGWSFGWGKQNKLRAENFIFDGKLSCFDFFADNKFVTAVRVPLLGQHNILNTLAVLSFFFYFNENLGKVAGLLENFKGIKRRFQIRETVGGVTFVDDYAHHPTEIKAVLDAARYLAARRVFVIFEPHRFSRVKMLYKEFGRCFSLADELVVTDIYAASEKNDQPRNTCLLREEIDKSFSGKVRYISKEKLADEVPQYLQDGDLCLGLGAGNITVLMDGIIHEFKKKRGKVQI